MDNKNIKETNQFISRHSSTDWVSGLVLFIILSFTAIAAMQVVSTNTVFNQWLSESGDQRKLLQTVITTTFLIFALLMTAFVYFSKTTKATILGLLGIAITGFLIHLLTHGNLEGSSLFYIGLPMLLAYVFKSSGSAKTATGGILQGTSIVMLLSGPFLQEGFVCVVMAAPLFYIIGGIVGLIIDYSRKKSLNKLQASPMLLLVAIMSLEGTHPDLSFNRDHTVRIEKIIDTTPEEVAKQLEQPLVLGREVPAFLKIFPFPTVKHHTGTQLGDQTTLHFVYYKHFYFSPKIGDLTYEVTKRGTNYIESKVIHDDSYVDTYMDWKTSNVSWEAINAEQTKVTWEIQYHRKLDPAWYFGTLEYFTTSLMAEALIKYAATPEFARS